MRSQGEEHRYNPQTIHLLQQSTWTGSYDLFKQYTDLVDKENHGNLRGLLDFKFAETPVPLEEVESVDDIVPCPMVPFHRKHMRHWQSP